MLQQTPNAMMAAPPVEVTVPPLFAESEVIALTADVVTVGKEAAGVEVVFEPHPVAPACTRQMNRTI